MTQKIAREGQQHDAYINRLTLRHYLEATLQYKTSALVTLIGFSVTTICMGAILPYVLAHAIDLVSQQKLLTLDSELTNTLFYAVIIVLVGTVSNSIGLKSFAHLSFQVQNHLRSQVFDRLARESAAFYAGTMSGSLTSNIIAYVNGYATIQEIVTQRGINRALPIVAGIGIVATQSLLLAGVFLIIVFGIGAKTLLDSRKRAPYRHRRKETTSKLNGFVGDVIVNSTTVRTFAGELREKQNLVQKQQNWQIASLENLQLFSSHYISLVGIINILQVGGVGLAAWLATTGQINLGLVVFAASYFRQLSSALFDLGPIVQSYQGALMDATPISEILARQPSVVDQPRSKKLKVHEGSILLETVTYRYSPAAPSVFDNLSLQIAPGQSIGLVGRSGGGKTTLTNLILRFADVESGSITIDGQNIHTVTQRSLRAAIAYVPQDPQLFHRSIRENIAYGKLNASDKDVVTAAKKAHIWDFIQTLPDGLDTTVGERGVKLSGGQRQRIAIARAILKNAPILVFDEATSSLDSESERRIQASLDELTEGRTAIVIAHRLSTIQKMDRIVVLDKGRIIEDGTHAQLIENAGVYASLWAHQSGGFISEQ